MTGHFSAPVEPLVALDAAVLAGRDVDVHARLVLHHAAVGAEVDPALVRVLGHHQAARADVASAVQLVDERHRKLEQVDVVALEDVLHHRPGVHHAVRDRVVLRDLRAGRPHQVQVRVVEGQAQRQRHALERGVLGEQHPEALGVILDLVVEHRGDRSRCFPGRSTPRASPSPSSSRPRQPSSTARRLPRSPATPANRCRWGFPRP